MGGTQKDDCEKLFLLEGFVDSLVISNSSLNLDKNLEANLTDTCVLFQFLHYPPLLVCESDFIGSPMGHRDSSHITFKSGKSCFFSLRSPRGPLLPVPFQVRVSVIRKLKEGMLPDKLEIGKTDIDMTDDFTDLLKQNTLENCDALPLSRNKKGSFEIQNDQGKVVGSLTAFIRLSCFGKLIITQFSVNKEDEKSFLFKGTDPNKLCQSADGGGRPCAAGDKPGVTEASFSRFMDKSPSTVGRGRPVPAMEQDKPPGKGGYLQRPPPMGTDFGGCPEARAYGYPADFSSRPFAPPSSPYGGRGGLCDCPYPVPPSVMSKYNQRSAAAERNMGLSPGEVGLHDDQVIFQLPLKKQGDPLTDRDKQIDSSVYYKLTSAEETKDGQYKNTVHIKSDDLPGMAAKQAAVSPISGLPVDDDHDVFLLKIGKKCDGDKKRNLELELRTPKMKEPKPPMTDQNTQYLESDIPKPDKRKSKDKGKKKGGSKSGKSDKSGKGGKGKKGKK